MNILVADDAPESRRLLEMLLGRAGHTVATAPDGAAALEALRAGDHGLAFVDWEMPGIDGLELCRRIRAEAPHDLPYIILLTGRAGPEDAIRGIEAGADDYMVKPLDVDQLRMRLAVAERAIRQRHALRDARRAAGSATPPAS